MKSKKNTKNIFQRTVSSLAVGYIVCVTLLAPALSFGQAFSAPKPPLTASVVAGDGFATISWDQTTDDGGSPVTGYIVSTDPPLVNKTAAASATSYKYTGLTNGNTYNFSVAAQNSAGVSGYINAGSVTPVAGATGSTPTTPGSGGGSSAALSKQLYLKNPLNSGTATVPNFIKNILSGVVLLVTPFLVIMMIYCGFLFVTANGNAEKLGEAKKALMYTLVGAAIVLGAQGLSTVIGTTVGHLTN